MSLFPENSASRMIVHKTAVLLKRRTKTFALEGGGGAAGVADVSDICAKLVEQLLQANFNSCWKVRPGWRFTFHPVDRSFAEASRFSIEAMPPSEAIDGS